MVLISPGKRTEVPLDHVVNNVGFFLFSILFTFTYIEEKDSQTAYC